VLEDQLAAVELLAVLYVLIGVTLASAPIVYGVVRHGTEIRALIGAIPKSAILVLACLFIAAATSILDGVAYLLGSFVLSLAVAGLTKQDQVSNILSCLRRHRRRRNVVILEIRRSAQADYRKSIFSLFLCLRHCYHYIDAFAKFSK